MGCDEGGPSSLETGSSKLETCSSKCLDPSAPDPSAGAAADEDEGSARDASATCDRAAAALAGCCGGGATLGAFPVARGPTGPAVAAVSAVSKSYNIVNNTEQCTGHDEQY